MFIVLIHINLHSILWLCLWNFTAYKNVIIGKQSSYSKKFNILIRFSSLALNFHLKASLGNVSVLFIMACWFVFSHVKGYKWEVDKSWNIQNFCLQHKCLYKILWDERYDADHKLIIQWHIITDPEFLCSRWSCTRIVPSGLLQYFWNICLELRIGESSYSRN